MHANESERLFDLGTARREKIPLKNGRPIAPSTLCRWIRKGASGVRLNVVLRRRHALPVTETA